MPEESQKHLSFRDRIAARKKEDPVKMMPVEGIGIVPILRLNARQALGIINDDSINTGHALVLACVLDEHKTPLFPSLAAVEELDWPLLQAFARACNSVNLLDVENAKKKIDRSPLLKFALSLGFELKKTLREIGEMDLGELALWMAFFKYRDPHRRDYWRAGMVASVIANCHGDGGFSPEDFMPMASEESSEVMDDAAIERSVKSFFEARKSGGQP